MADLKKLLEKQVEKTKEVILGHKGKDKISRVTRIRSPGKDKE